MKLESIISAIFISAAVVVSAVIISRSVDGLARAVQDQQINSGMPQRVEISGLSQLRVDVESLPHFPAIKFESVPPTNVPAR
jgi:hypothetical protein